MKAREALLTMIALSLGACAEPPKGAERADREFKQFQIVYPILVRDCGFHTCHGSSDRFFQISGPGRVRLDPASKAFDGVTGDEISASFDSALSMIDAKHPQASLLLRKPLALEVGGMSHGGADDFGRNVYRTVNDQGFLAISNFVFSPAPAPAE
jgi:hypothetical protein